MRTSPSPLCCLQCNVHGGVYVLPERIYVLPVRFKNLCRRLLRVEKLRGAMVRADCTYNPRGGAVVYLAILLSLFAHEV